MVIKCASMFTGDKCIEHLQYYGGWDVVILLIIMFILGILLGRDIEKQKWRKKEK